MKIKVNFHSSLTQYTYGLKEFTFEVEDFKSLSFAIYNTFKDLVVKFMDFSNYSTSKDMLLLLEDNKNLIDEQFIMRNPKDVKEVYVVPSICGGGRGKSSILIGAAIAAFAFFALPAILGPAAASGGSFFGNALTNFQALSGFSGFLAEALLGVGLNLILGGILSLFQKKPDTPSDQPQDIDSRQQNDVFGSLGNTIDSDTDIPIVYGLHRVGGQFISGYVKNINHGKTDSINVGEQF